jgi:hypothetical protein
MSRAVFAVVVCGSIHAVGAFAHRRAMSRARGASFATSAALCVYGGKLPRAICSSVSSHVSGVLRATPRGSKPIRS